MYIARRTGGGRGVYEIAGHTATGLTSADLLDREIVFEFPPDLQLRTGVVLNVQGGKRRLRIAAADIQIQRQLAAALMFPKPRRVNDAGSSPLLPASGEYVIERIHLDFTNHMFLDTAVVVPSIIELKNLVAELSVEAQPRLAALRRVWEASLNLPEPLRTLVGQHRDLTTSSLPIGRACEQVVSGIQREVAIIWPDKVQAAGDPLPVLADYLNFSDIPAATPAEETQSSDFGLEEIAGLPRRVLRPIIQRRGQWSFRQGLLAAYGYSCQVTQYTGEQALEAAHIYPYSEGGEFTNDLRNGLLLRADIHVLFDLGLLKVAPGSLAVRIMDPLDGTSYKALDGTVLRASTSLRPSDEALEQKWAQGWPQHG